jgi:hypothetical protein
VCNKLSLQLSSLRGKMEREGTHGAFPSQTVDLEHATILPFRLGAVVVLSWKWDLRPFGTHLKRRAGK